MVERLDLSALSSAHKVTWLVCLFLCETPTSNTWTSVSFWVLWEQIKGMKEEKLWCAANFTSVSSPFRDVFMLFPSKLKTCGKARNTRQQLHNLRFVSNGPLRVHSFLSIEWLFFFMWKQGVQNYLLPAAGPAAAERQPSEAGGRRREEWWERGGLAGRTGHSHTGHARPSGPARSLETKHNV